MVLVVSFKFQSFRGEKNWLTMTQYKEGHKIVLVFSNSREFSSMALVDVRLWHFKAQFSQ